MSPAPQSAVLIVHERDIARHDRLLEEHGAELRSLRLDLTTVRVKLGFYAALGATLGAAGVQVVISLLFKG